MALPFRRSLNRVVLTFGVVFVAAQSFADLKVISQIQTSMNGDYHPLEYATTYYKGDWIRIDSKNHTILTNAKKHETIDIDHITKTYEITDEDLAGQAADLMKVMGAKVSAKVEPTDEHKQIVGLNANKYLAELTFKMRRPTGTGNAPPDVQLKIHLESWATLDLPVTSGATAMMSTANDMLASLFSLTGAGDAKRELSKIKGFSLSNKVTMVLDAPDAPAPIAFEVDYDIISLSQATINQAMFRVPSDYKAASEGDDTIPWRPAKEAETSEAGSLFHNLYSPRTPIYDLSLLHAAIAARCSDLRNGDGGRRRPGRH